jgi:hypothetical protein
MNSSMEKMRGGMKPEFSLSAKNFLRKWEGLFPGKTTRLVEKSLFFSTRWLATSSMRLFEGGMA